MSKLQATIKPQAQPTLDQFFRDVQEARMEAETADLFALIVTETENLDKVKRHKCYSCVQEFIPLVGALARTDWLRSTAASRIEMMTGGKIVNVIPMRYQGRYFVYAQIARPTRIDGLMRVLECEEPLFNTVPVQIWVGV